MFKKKSIVRQDPNLRQDFSLREEKNFIIFSSSFHTLIKILKFVNLNLRHNSNLRQDFWNRALI